MHNWRLAETQGRLMNDECEYIPPRVWKWENKNGGNWESINRPIAGPTHEKQLPVGKHPLQLYSMATPNGVKVTVMLEELLALGFEGAQYDAHLIKIGDGKDQPELENSGLDGLQLW